MTDPRVKAVKDKLADYDLARVPMPRQEHAFIVAVLELLAHKSGLVVSMRIGDGLITRGGE